MGKPPFVALVTVLVASLAGGCSSHVAGRSARRPALINHVVFFKLHDEADRAALVTACDDLLAPIPGVVAYYAGTHLETGRSTVESNYDVGLYLGFDSEADLSAYVEHPDHKQLVATWKPSLEWFRVYDVVVGND